MGRTLAAMNIRGLLIVCGGVFVVTAAVAAQGATVRDRIYTDEQADRGKGTYDAKCASCHDGGTMGPELWGDAFLTSWENKALAEFFTRVKMTMPEDAPGSLSPKDVLDVIAYVLKTNGFPAGDNALDSSDPLTAIKFVKK